MSNATSLIKKRQVMRLAFGDYRAKMVAEEKNCKSQAKIKLAIIPPNKKSTFLKKSAFLTNTGNSFRFNFDPPTEDVAQNISNLNLDNKPLESVTTRAVANSEQNDQFVKSDNSFRFNFDCDST